PDLGTFGRVGVAAREAAAVARDAGAAGECPGGAGRIVLEVAPTAGADVRNLEAGIADGVDTGRVDGHVHGAAGVVVVRLGGERAAVAADVTGIGRIGV